MSSWDVAIANWNHGYETTLSSKGVTITLFGTEHEAELERENRRLKQQLEAVYKRVDDTLAALSARVYESLGLDAPDAS